MKFKIFVGIEWADSSIKAIIEASFVVSPGRPTGSLVQSSPVSKHSQRGTLNGLVETQTPHEPTILTTVLASRKQSRLFRIVHSSSQACNSIKKTREFELNISYHIFKPFCLYYTYIAVFGIFIVKLITGNSRFIIYHKVKGWQVNFIEEKMLLFLCFSFLYWCPLHDEHTNWTWKIEIFIKTLATTR
jgi:hypothetical protein